MCILNYKKWPIFMPVFVLNGATCKKKHNAYGIMHSCIYPSTYMNAYIGVRVSDNTFYAIFFLSDA